MFNDIVTRLRERQRELEFWWPDDDPPLTWVSEAADEIERLRSALALACGLLSTYYAMSPPDQLMQQFLEEARRD